VIGTPYDILMIAWGLVFILGWVGFIAGMNRLFRREEQETEALESPGESPSPQQPLHPAA